MLVSTGSLQCVLKTFTMKIPTKFPCLQYRIDGLLSLASMNLNGPHHRGVRFRAWNSSLVCMTHVLVRCSRRITGEFGTMWPQEQYLIRKTSALDVSAGQGTQLIILSPQMPVRSHMLPRMRRCSYMPWHCSVHMPIGCTAVLVACTCIP
jgi:hypothetical protein